MEKEQLISYAKYVSVSLTSAGIELFLFDLLIRFLEKPFPLLYVTIATVLARIVADSYKFLLDRRMVFEAEGSFSGGALKYIVLAVSKTAASAFFVTLLAELFAAFDETLIKMAVDIILFFPGYFIEKKWVHEV